MTPYRVVKLNNKYYMQVLKYVPQGLTRDKTSDAPAHCWRYLFICANSQLVENIPAQPVNNPEETPLEFEFSYQAHDALDDFLQYLDNDLPLTVIAPHSIIE